MLKKIGILLIVMLVFLTGCHNLNNLNYDDIINEVISETKNPNVHKKGFQFYMPKGLSIKNSKENYVILSSNKNDYYLYVDLISYNAHKDLNINDSNNSYYFTGINKNGIKGYVDINLKENNQYLIEIIYNYAKIEVMVDKDMIKNALANSISILNSIKYNDEVIEQLLNDDNLDYTEEVFDMFKDYHDNSDILDRDTNDETIVEQDEPKDLDYIN